MSKLIFFSLFLLINFSFEGNVVNIKDQLLLMPYPQKVTLNYNGTEALQVESSVKLIINSEQCTDKCQSFLNDNFKDIIISQIEQKQKLSDFRISLHDPIDFPKKNYSIGEPLTTIELSFTQNETSKIYPDLKIGVDESYSMDINSTNIIITSQTVFGARHAFETLNQLLRINDSTKKCIIVDIPIHIEDFPRFKWRGLMIDPARNPLKLSFYKRIIDALSLFKSNVLHIHLADSQNFLFESKKHPELSEKGVFDQNKVLKQSFIEELSTYAEKKGIIIYGGINFPGHSGSIGLSNPNAVCDIWDYILDNDILNGEDSISLNPADNSTFDLINDIIGEIGTSFKSDYIHVGGETVPQYAWTQSKNWNNIVKFMNEHQLENTSSLEKYLNYKTQKAVINLKKTPIIYQDVFENNGAKAGSIIHVWSNKEQIEKAVKKGYKVIISEGFELNKQQPYCHYYDTSKCSNIYMYVWNNRRFLDALSITELTEKIEEGVLGGEGSAWGESVDEQNFFDVVFQRYGAIAERFWSSKEINDPNSHEVRANYVRCLGLRKGTLLGTGPLYHGICNLENETQ
ncbi:MAG: beta-N-acetylhexosaminidase [archaeon]|nr:beta-N-acetylhexosaminidase [archaeon]